MCVARTSPCRCRRTFDQIVSLNYSLCDAQHRRMLSIISVDFPVSMLSWDTITRSGDNCVWLHERDSISFGGDFFLLLLFSFSLCPDDLRVRIRCIKSNMELNGNRCRWDRRRRIAIRRQRRLVRAIYFKKAPMSRTPWGVSLLQFRMQRKEVFSDFISCVCHVCHVSFVFHSYRSASKV